MLWKDYSSFWCSAGVFHKGLSFLVHLQATSMVFCILPFFLLIPSGSLPPTVSGLSRANRCSSKGKDAHPLVMLGLCGVTLCKHAGAVLETPFLSILSSPTVTSWMEVSSVISCGSPWDQVVGAREELRQMFFFWFDVLGVALSICCEGEVLSLITC